MLTVRVVQRQSAAARSAWATAEIVTTLVAAHTAAGGVLPSLPWIGAMAGVVFLAGLGVLKGRVSSKVAVPALVVAQLLLHCYLTVLTPASGSMGQMQMGTGFVGHLHHVLTLPMLAAHVIGAVITALVWESRARAVDVLIAWSRPPRALLPVARRLVAETAPLVRPATQQVIAVAPRRGPPVLVRFA